MLNRYSDPNDSGCEGGGLREEPALQKEGVDCMQRSKTLVAHVDCDVVYGDALCIGEVLQQDSFRRVLVL